MELLNTITLNNEGITWVMVRSIIGDRRVPL